MSVESPPHPSKRAQIALGVVLLATFVYSVVIAAQILLWVVLVGIVVGIYVAWLLVVALFRLVDAVERIAAAQEATVATDPTHGHERTVDEE